MAVSSNQITGWDFILNDIQASDTINQEGKEEKEEKEDMCEIHEIDENENREIDYFMKNMIL